jgi:hypothetical protein
VTRGAGVTRAALGPWHLFLIALGLLLGQGTTTLHLLLVPHATCEHGELMEVHASARPASGPASASRAAGAEPQIERGDADRGSHDHCDALAVRHRVPEVAAPLAGASLAWILPDELGEERPEARPVPLLSVAPKSSPPC